MRAYPDLASISARAQLVESLRGQIREHHRFMLRLHLDQVSSLRNAIAELEIRLGERLQPFQADVTLLVPFLASAERSSGHGKRNRHGDASVPQRRQLGVLGRHVPAQR